MMTKTAKLFLSLLSWMPFTWTVVILLATLTEGTFDYDSFEYGLKRLLRWMLHPDFLTGLLILWSLLLLLLTWNKMITSKQCAVHIIILLAGLLFAYLSLKYDLFCVAGCYID